MPTDLVLTRRTQRTRDKLLRVARAVFEADGYDGASVARIVEDADVSRGTFYLYFESKEDIFRTLATTLQEGILHAQEWPADAPPEEIVRAATSAFLTFYREHARLMAVLEQVATYDASFRSMRREMRRGTARRARRFITSLQEQGAASPTIDAAYAAVALTGMMDRFAYVWFVLDEDFEEERALATLTELWMRAIGAWPAC